MPDCPNCGTWNPDDKLVCWRCQTELPKPQPKKKETAAHHGHAGVELGDFGPDGGLLAVGHLPGPAVVHPCRRVVAPVQMAASSPFRLRRVSQSRCTALRGHGSGDLARGWPFAHRPAVGR